MLDVADPNMLVGRRPTTNVPAQALVLINSPEVNHWAELTADRILQSATRFDTRLRHVYLDTLQRDPDRADREHRRCVLCAPRGSTVKPGVNTLPRFLRVPSFDCWIVGRHARCKHEAMLIESSRRQFGTVSSFALGSLAVSAFAPCATDVCIAGPRLDRTFRRVSSV